MIKEGRESSNANIYSLRWTMHLPADSRELEYREEKIIQSVLLGAISSKTDGKHSDKHIILFRT